jgi:hypothetical protein
MTQVLEYVADIPAALAEIRRPGSNSPHRVTTHVAERIASVR